MTNSERNIAGIGGSLDQTSKGVHSLSVQEASSAFAANSGRGLTEIEASNRFAQSGANEIEEEPSNRLLHFLVGQASSIVIWLLAFAALIAWITGNSLEAVAILVVLVLNAVIGFAIEWQAGRALDALRRTTITTARVKRDGVEKLIDASKLVVGDTVVFTAGDRAPADARIIESTNLRADESTLTGESLPVEKGPSRVAKDTPLAERTSMLFLGTTIVAGHGSAIVTGTGRNTEIGRIGELVSSAERGKTPLEYKLANLGKRLVYVVLGIALVVLIAGVLRGDEIWLMLEVAISLAVAAVPEGLPAVTTLILALGVLRMARRNAIVRRLSAVETLGSSTVICADKTGTLTENRMTVREYYLSDERLIKISKYDAENDPDDGLRRILDVSVLCNEAIVDPDSGDEDRAIGDPTEVALLVAAQKLTIDTNSLRSKHPIVFEQPFDADTKRMTVIFEDAEAGLRAALKGAPSVVIENCSHFRDSGGNIVPMDDAARAHFLSINRQMADRALRVLALADKPVQSGSEFSDAADSDYIFLGFAGMTDPPRDGVKEAIREARDAGIRVVMLTGDQLHTARAIAGELSIGDSSTYAYHSKDLERADGAKLARMARQADVFARVTPENKLRIVKALQETGEIVAVTGDGVNDAPALKNADIGVAMGMRGTEVAKESSDIILTDDNFTTIVNAIEGGRTIYANIIKFVHMMFSHNLGEVILIFVAIVAGLPLPLLPLQILWINLVTDVFPALALAVEPPSPNTMTRNPQSPSKALLSNRFMILILWQGALLGAIALGAYVRALQQYGPGDHSRTVALLAIVAVQLGHFFNCRSRNRSAFSRFFSNPFLFVATGIVVALQALAIYFPPLTTVLHTVAPNTTDYFVIVSCVLLPIIVVELTKLMSRFGKTENELYESAD